MTTSTIEKTTMKPTYIDWTEINGLAVKQKGMYAVYIANHLNFDDDDSYIWDHIVQKCTGLIPFSDVMSILHGGLFFFDTKTEMTTFFNIFCESPVESSGVYACNYNNNGECLSENT